MPRSYKPLDLPNLIHLTAPENLEFMERMEAEEEAKKKTKAPTKAATVNHISPSASVWLMSNLETPQTQS